MLGDFIAIGIIFVIGVFILLAVLRQAADELEEHERSKLDGEETER